MSNYHPYYAPYRVGERVQIIEGTNTGKQGTVARVEPERVRYAGEAFYFVLLDGDTFSGALPYTFEQIELVPPQQEEGQGQ